MVNVQGRKSNPKHNNCPRRKNQTQTKPRKTILLVPGPGFEPGPPCGDGLSRPVKVSVVDTAEIALDLARPPRRLVVIAYGLKVFASLIGFNHEYYSSITVFINVPIPSISASTTSPPLRNLFLGKPTPAGVPVLM